MSHAVAIAAVTAVLKDILENGLTSSAIATSIGDVLVTALPPDRITVGSDERPQLNLFLYQVSQNRNADWVERERAEKQPRYSRMRSQLNLSNASSPDSLPLALDLHYLITAYGAKDFQAELLLGYAIQLLHDSPVVTQDRIHAALKHAAELSTSGALSQVLSALSITDLAAQVGSLTLHPEFFSMEETSKLWSSLQTHYRPSAGYQASMVWIESSSSAGSLSAPRPLSDPQIEQATVTADYRLVIQGQQLQGMLPRVRLSGYPTLLTPQEQSDHQISVALPLDLPAGVQGVQVIRYGEKAMNNQDAHEYPLVESNISAIVVPPAIISVQIIEKIEKSARTSKGNQKNAELTLVVRPLIHASQQIVIWLRDADGNVIHRIPVMAEEQLTETLALPIVVPIDSYHVQLQIDGVSSDWVTLPARTTPQSPQSVLP